MLHFMPYLFKAPIMKSTVCFDFSACTEKTRPKKNTGYAPQPKVLNIMTALEKMPVTNI